MPKILVIDDDRAINELVKINLELQGHVVIQGFNGTEGFALAKQEQPDLIVLDVMMPEVDGFTVAQRIRQTDSIADIPIIMLTALSQLNDKVSGFNIGVDDYLVKPFDIQEVLLRIRVLLRRNQPQVETLGSTEILDVGEIEILPDTLECIILNKRVKLTPTEFEILYCLMQHFNKAVTLATLLEEVWGYDRDEDVRMLRVHVGGLRNKIEPDTKNPKYLHTVTNVGYKLTPFGN